MNKSIKQDTLNDNPIFISIRRFLKDSNFRLH